MGRDHQTTILVVDDSPEDFEMLTLAFAACGAKNPLRQCLDAEAAMAYINKRPPFAGVPTPGLILLDLSLPDVDGRALLDTLKKHERARTIPVVILSTSNNPRDVEDCYRKGAACYAIKPLGIEGLERLIKTLCDFWLESVVLPHER